MTSPLSMARRSALWCALTLFALSARALGAHPVPSFEGNHAFYALGN